MISVDLAHEVLASLRSMADKGMAPQHCAASTTNGGWCASSTATTSALSPETTRRIELHGWGPDSVLAAPDIIKPDDVELQVVSEDLGQGETDTSYRYQWTDGSRSILAEEIKNEIYGGATPYSTYVRGVIIDGDRGVLLTGRDDSALVIEG